MILEYAKAERAIQWFLSSLRWTSSKYKLGIIQILHESNIVCALVLNVIAGGPYRKISDIRRTNSQT